MLRLTVTLIGLAIAASAVSANLDGIEKHLDKSASPEANLEKVKELAVKRDCKSCFGLKSGRANVQKIIELDEATKNSQCDLATTFKSVELNDMIDRNRAEKRAVDLMLEYVLENYGKVCQGPVEAELTSKLNAVPSETQKVVRKLGEDLYKEFEDDEYDYARQDYGAFKTYLHEQKLRNPFWPLYVTIKEGAVAAQDEDAQYLEKSPNVNTEALERMFKKYVQKPCKEYVDALQPVGDLATLLSQTMGKANWYATDLSWKNAVVDYHTCRQLIGGSEVKAALKELRELSKRLPK